MKSNIIKSIFFALLMLVSMTANAQVQAFEKYSNVKDISYVYVSKTMLSMAMSRMEPGSPLVGSVPGFTVKGIMNKLSGLQVITSKTEAAGKVLKSETMAIVKNGKYNLMMQADNAGEKVRIYDMEGKKQSVIVMITEESKETTVIVFSGTFTKKDIAGLIK